MMLGAIDSFNYIYDSFQNNFFIKDYSEYIPILNTWLNAYSPYLHKIEEMKKRSNYKENDISNYMKCINNVIIELNEYINKSENT
jgi:hypothetical protein